MKINYEIEGDLPANLTKEEYRNIMEIECMKIVEVGISALIKRYFPKLDFNAKRDLIGFWYVEGGQIPLAKIEDGNFYWLKEIPWLRSK
jgi:hypothetical protein